MAGQGPAGARMARLQPAWQRLRRLRGAAGRAAAAVASPPAHGSFNFSRTCASVRSLTAMERAMLPFRSNAGPLSLIEGLFVAAILIGPAAGADNAVPNFAPDSRIGW